MSNENVVKSDLDAGLSEIDGELPEHLTAPDNDGIDGLALTPEAVYGDEKVDVASDRENDLTPDALKDDDDPTDATAHKPKPKDGKPASEDGEKKGEWDAARQKTDQQLAALKKQVDALKTQVGGKPGDDAETPALSEVEQDVADAQAELDGLDENTAEFDEFVVVMRKVAGALGKQVLSLKQKLAEAGTEEPGAADVSAYEALVDEAAGEVGETFRTEIIAGISKLFTDRGYTEDQHPDEDGMRDLVFRVAQSVKAGHLEKGTKPETKGSKKRKTPPPTDSGEGGARANIMKSDAEDVDAAIEDMKGEGKLGWMSK